MDNLIIFTKPRLVYVDDYHEFYYLQATLRSIFPEGLPVVEELGFNFKKDEYMGVLYDHRTTEKETLQKFKTRHYKDLKEPENIYG